MTQWAELQQIVERLEKAKPDSRTLLHLHVLAIGYLRGVLTYNDRYNAALHFFNQGDDQRAQKYKKEAHSWYSETLPRVNERFARELIEIKQGHPVLYAMLRIPQETFAGIEEWGSDK